MPQLARTLLAEGGRMQMVYAWQPDPGEIELCYVGSPAGGGRFLLWRCRPHGAAPSLAAIWPALGWYEREIMDLYGLSFSHHPEPNHLLLSEEMPPPLRRPHHARRARGADVPRALPELVASGVQVLPFGPVRADVTEAAEFTFFYAGEQILYYHPHLFFKHRGIEARFQTMAPLMAVALAERVSGVGSVAHALAYCQAVEAAADCTPPPRALALRVLLAELERLVSHLHFFGHLCATTTLKVGEAEGKLLEEQAKQILGRLTGSRFGRGLLTPGGMRRDLPAAETLGAALGALEEQASRYVARLERTGSHLDRLIGTGVLKRDVALDQGATGPVQRASGIDRDLRRDHPYAAYDGLPLAVAGHTDGDARARALVRAQEIVASFALLRSLLATLPPGPVRAACAPAAGAEGLGWAESPRGTLFYAVHLSADGQLARVKIKSPSYSNWRVFPFTVHETNMMDYAINEASFGLSVAGCAR
jgi:Ni,Fe-hydrogenase III large subunit